MGLVHGLVVHEANIQDRDGAKLVVHACGKKLKTVKRIWADGGYRGKLVEWMKVQKGIALEIVEKLPEQRGFKVLPKRWVVERTFAWLGGYRRLSKDYEQSTQSSEGGIYLALLHRMTRRLVA